jgi:homoserine dehydrogenase
VWRVSLIALKPDHRLAQTAGDWNTLLIQRESGETIAVSGRGAGRWATAEAIMADLFELRRTRLALRGCPS